MSALGFKHQRIIALDLKVSDKSVGQVIFFDEQLDAFTQDAVENVYELASGFLNLLHLRMENAELKELYEQQVAMNVSKTKFFQIIAHDLRAPFHGLIDSQKCWLKSAKVWMSLVCKALQIICMIQHNRLIAC